jgi:nitrite reductase/ring-hydroxylating ferredoxin subunit
MPRHVVAAVAEIPPGGKKIVEVLGRSIGVFNLGGQFFALRNRCPHQAGPLCEGPLGSCVSSSAPGEYEVTRAGEFLRCPWHGWEFDVRTGQSWFDPKMLRVKSYPAAVVPGRALAPPAPGLVPGPYVAETYPVSIEQDYVVVEF